MTHEVEVDGRVVDKWAELPDATTLNPPEDDHQEDS